MKKRVSLLLAAIMLVSVIAGCAQREKRDTPYLVTDHFDNQNIGIIKGNTSKETIKNEIENPKIKTYRNAEAGINALRKGRIEGMILDAYDAYYYAVTYDDLKTLLEVFDENQLVMPVTNMRNDEQNYLLVIDASVSRMKGDGTYNKLMTKYFKGNAPEEYTPPTDYTRVEGRTLEVGIDTELSQFVTKDDAGNYSGFFVDFAKEIAKDNGAELVIREYKKDEMITAIKNGDIIFALSDFAKPDEDGAYSEEIVYSAPYFDASQVIVILDPLAQNK